MKYGIIGNGRVAKHFKHYFDILNIKYSAWDRKNNDISDFDKIFEGCETILILIKDSAIEEISKKLIFLNKNLIHFSGSLVTDMAYGVHPLMTFNEDLYDIEVYKNIPFVADSKDILDKGLLKDIPNKIYFLDKDQKPFYHALCVMGGNFSCILWQRVIEDFQEKLNLPREILLPYIEQIFKNILKDEKKALTGPLIRGDDVTIEKNIESLYDDSSKRLYEAFIDYYRRK